MMRLAADPYAFDQAGGQAASELMQWSLRQMERTRCPFITEYINWDMLR
jgi:hypothetical protein